MTGSAEKLFEIKLTPSQVLLRIASSSDGKKSSLSDIQKELKNHEVSYRHEQLFDIYRRATNQFEVLTTRETEHYSVAVEVKNEGLEATMTIFPPTRGGEKLDPRTIKKAILDAKITKGVLYDDIQKAIRDPAGKRPVVIARGKMPLDGTDGRIDFLLDSTGTDPAPPAGPGDASPDFKELGLIRNVESGQVIARIFAPTPGENGFTVFGAELKARQGKAVRPKAGRNVALSEDGTELRATSAGYVLNTNDKIAVENVYLVENVNAETGNVHFSGVVVCRGNVDDNFSIDSEKGIEVGGMVGKANLRSGGDVKILGGAIGATIEAARNVAAKFFSEVTVQAGENVTAEEYILHSTVQAGKVVRVTKSPTGFINGGVTRAADSVFSPNLGSNVAEEKTVIEAGMRPNMRAQFDALSLKMEKDELAFEKLRKNLLILQQQRETTGAFDPQKDEMFGKLLETGRQLREELMENIGTYRTVAAGLQESENEQGFVLVSNTVFPGVSVQIRRQSVKIKSAIIGGGFRLAHGELKVQDVVDVQRIYKAQNAKKPA